MSKKYNQKLISDSMLGALTAIVAILVIFAILLSVFLIVARPFSSEGGKLGGGKNDKATYPFRQDIKFSAPKMDNAIAINSADINSEKAVIMNVTDNEIIASRQSSQIMYPASMTKVMTLIVVFENLKSENSLNEVLTISGEVVAQMEAAKSSGYGFKAGEKLTVKELIYAMILESDNIACITLAEYISGSEAAFVSLMNEKAREMGLADSTTLFQNCTGLHHKYHYSTCKDIAIIMAYAMQNTFCAEVLTSLSLKVGSHFRPDSNNPIFYNQFLVHNLNIQNPPHALIQPQKAEIIAGKTGFTDYETSGSCLVSFAKGDDGKEYIVVTAKASSPTNRLDDHLYLYNTYAD